MAIRPRAIPDLKRPKILILAGPTASGKTAVALEISKLLPAEMISCDSMQVYRSMPIITQSPSKNVARALKTHLVSCVDPANEYSAASFRKDALALIPEILKNKRLPLLAGGTGLYVRALLDGLFETEGQTLFRDEAYRQRLLAEQGTRGGDYLHQKLHILDPAAAAKIHPNDLRRLVRALEIFHLTKKTKSEQASNRRGIREDFDVRLFFLDWDRADLYERINRRVDQMFKAGLVKEARGLLKKKLSPTASMALGLREVKAHLDGKLTLDEAKKLIKQNTRHYSKRQVTWFRHERNVEWIKVESNESAKNIAKRIVASFMAGGAVGSHYPSRERTIFPAVENRAR